MIDNLERARLITRRRDAADRRKTTLTLTARGRALIRRVFPDHVDAIVREFAVLTRVEQAALGLLCKKLGLQTGVRGAVAPPVRTTLPAP